LKKLRLSYLTSIFNFVIMIDRIKELQRRSSRPSLEMGERQPILNEPVDNGWARYPLHSGVPNDTWQGSQPAGSGLQIARREISYGIGQIGEATREIERIRSALNHSSSDQAIHSYLREVDMIMKRTNKLAGELKDSITALQAENDEFKAKNGESLEIMWRANHLRSVVKSFQKHMASYSTSLNDFNRTTVNRNIRQHRYLNSNLSQDDIAAMELDPIRAHNELIQKLEEYDVSDGTIDKIASLEEQNTQIREIEKGVQLISRLFEEMNIMVIEQGDILDSIENNVEATRLYVKKGLDQIDKATSHTAKARKKKVCIAILCLTIIIVIMMVWLL